MAEFYLGTIVESGKHAEMFEKHGVLCFRSGEFDGKADKGHVETHKIEFGMFMNANPTFKVPWPELAKKEIEVAKEEKTKKKEDKKGLSRLFGSSEEETAPEDS